MIWAAGREHPEIVALLLAQGATPDLSDKQGRSALMIAVDRGNGRIVQMLLAAGADPTLVDANGASARDRAAGGGSEAMLRLLGDGAHPSGTAEDRTPDR